MSVNSSASRPALPLSLVSSGETVEVLEVRVQGAEKQRLQELGLLPGATVRVIKSDALCGVIVSVRQDGRLALNRSIAHKLLVCLKDSEE